MKNIPLRKWSTPVIISSGLFVAVSGVLMYFGIKNPLEHAHELIGLLFAVGIILHVINHWKPFKNYFTQRFAVSIVGSIAIIASALILVSANQGGGNLMMNIIHTVAGSPLTEVAPLLDQTTEMVINKFSLAGFTVSGPDETINDIALNNKVEKKAVMHVLFKK
jgi:hypothetical protein